MGGILMENQTTEYSQPKLHITNEIETNERLTSSELANLWSLYMASTIRACTIEYFLKTVENPEIRKLLEYSQRLAQKQINWLSEIYAKEKHPIPRGFNIDEDINLDAPRLFTDSLIIRYLQEVGRNRIDGLTTALAMASRKDISTHFAQFLADEAALSTSILELEKSNGTHMRPPYIPVPEKIDFITKHSFIEGYLGQKRPLTTIEVSHLFSGLERNAFRKSLITGFAQVAKSEQLRKHLQRGIEISSKHIEIFSSVLIKNNLPVSMNWDSGIIESKIAPFSDMLILQKIDMIDIVLLTLYGKSISVTGTPSIGIDFMRLLIEIAKYSRDGWEILIDNGWAEEPPMAKVNQSIEKKLH